MRTDQGAKQAARDERAELVAQLEALLDPALAALGLVFLGLLLRDTPDQRDAAAAASRSSMGAMTAAGGTSATNEG